MAGAQDTGKTTLARMLTGELSARGVMTHYVTEFARDYIPKAGNVVTMAEELFLIEQQLKRERETPAEMQVMVTDSPVYLCYAYSTLLAKLGRMDKKDIIMLGRIYDKVLDAPAYDLTVLLPLVWTAKADGVRPKEMLALNGEVDRRIRSFLDLHGVTYIGISGEPNEARTASLRRYLEVTLTNVLGWL